MAETSNPMTDQDVFELSKRLKDLKDQKDALNTQLKAVNEELENVNRELSQLMVDNELQRFSLHGTLYYLSTDVYISEIADRREELYESIRQQGYGDLIKNTIPYQTLKSFVKEMMEDQAEAEDGDPKPPPWLRPFVRVYKADKVKTMKEQ